MEELSKDYGLDIDRDLLYNALKGHRYAFTEILREIKK